MSIEIEWLEKENLTSENIELKTRLELEKQAESDIYSKYKLLLKN